MALESEDIVEVVLHKLGFRHLCLCSMVSCLWRNVADKEKSRLKILRVEGDVERGACVDLSDALDEERPKITFHINLPTDPPPPPLKIIPDNHDPSSLVIPEYSLYFSNPLAFHQGQLLLYISAGEDKELMIFGDPLSNTWTTIPGLSSHHLGFTPYDAAFSHDGKLLLVSDMCKNTAILDVERNVWKMGYIPKFEDLRPGQDCDSYIPKIWDRTDPLHELKRLRMVWVDGAFYTCMFRSVRGLSWYENYDRHLVDNEWYACLNYRKTRRDVWGYTTGLDEVCVARFNMEEMRWWEVQVELPEGLDWEDVRDLQLLPLKDASRMVVVVHVHEKTGKKSCTTWYDPVSERLVVREWFESSASHRVCIDLAMSDEVKLWTAFDRSGLRLYSKAKRQTT